MPGPNLNQQAAERLNQQTQERVKGTYRDYDSQGKAEIITMKDRRIGIVNKRLERIDRLLANQENPTAAQNQLRSLLNQELSGEKVIHGLLASHEVVAELRELKNRLGGKLTREQNRILEDAMEIRLQFVDSLPTTKFGFIRTPEPLNRRHAVIESFERKYVDKFNQEIATNPSITEERRHQLREEVFMAELKKHGDTQLDALMAEIEAEEVKKLQEHDLHQRHQEKDKLEQHLTEHKEEYGKKTAELAKAEARKADLLAQREGLQESIDELAWQRDQIDLPVAVAHLQARLDRTTLERTTNEAELASLQAELDAIDTAVQDAKNAKSKKFDPEEERKKIVNLETDRALHTATAKEAKAKTEILRQELGKNPPDQRKLEIYKELTTLAGDEAMASALAQSLEAQIKTAEEVYSAKKNNRGELDANTITKFRRQEKSIRAEIETKTQEAEGKRLEENNAKKELTKAESKQAEKDRIVKEMQTKEYERDNVYKKFVSTEAEINALNAPNGEISVYRAKQKELDGVEKSIAALDRVLKLTPDKVAEALPEAALTVDGINQAFGVNLDPNIYQSVLRRTDGVANPLDVQGELKKMDSFSLWQFLIALLGGGEAYKI